MPVKRMAQFGRPLWKVYDQGQHPPHIQLEKVVTMKLLGEEQHYFSEVVFTCLTNLVLLEPEIRHGKYKK